jgi:hypothetical protein
LINWAFKISQPRQGNRREVDCRNTRNEFGRPSAARRARSLAQLDVGHPTKPGGLGDDIVTIFGHGDNFSKIESEKAHGRMIEKQFSFQPLFGG